MHRKPRKIKKKKLQSIRLLKKKVWRIVSELVRRRYADSSGFAECYTCNRRSHWKKLHCGHLLHRKLNYDLDNLKAQCPKCNLYFRGNLVRYTLRMLRENNPEFLYALEKRARKSDNKYSRDELNELYIKYSKMLSKL